MPSVRHSSPLPQELKELDPFTQPANHHLPIADHLAHDRRNLPGSKIESPIKFLDRIENFGLAQMRVVQRRNLDAFTIHELRIRGVKPTVFYRLIEKKRARIGRRQRDLNGVW